jgi:tetratricopeptide (TPR) repeat protein
LAAADGDEHVAQTDFEAAVAIDPDCWQAIHNRGVSRAVEGLKSEALRDFNRAIALNPDFAVAYRNRGELRSEVGLINAAIRDYGEAIRRAPRDAELRRIRGHASHRLGRFVDAIEDLNTAIRLDPDHAAAYTDRGNVYAELGYYHQALCDFQEALRLAPEHAAAYRSTAWVLATCPLARYRHAEKALLAARHALAKGASDDPLLLDAFAAAQASAGQYLAAAATETRALELAEGRPYAAGFRARLALYRRGEPFRETPRSVTPLAAAPSGDDAHSGIAREATAAPQPPARTRPKTMRYPSRRPPHLSSRGKR